MENITEIKVASMADEWFSGEISSSYLVGGLFSGMPLLCKHLPDVWWKPLI